MKSLKSLLKNKIKRMNKTALPKADNWDYFWGLEKTEKFTKVSWSKKRIIKVLRSYIQEGDKALDAGCGSGFFSKFFCDQGLSTVSLDYSPKALAIAQKATQGRARIVEGDLVSPGLNEMIPERFDLIFSDGLLEHFCETDQDKIIQNLVALLNDSGVIVTFVPNRWSPWELIRPFLMPGIEEKPFVLRQLVELNHRNGLAVIEKGGVNTFPFSLSPDNFFGPLFGMLLFAVAKKKKHNT